MKLIFALLVISMAQVDIFSQQYEFIHNKSILFSKKNISLDTGNEGTLHSAIFMPSKYVIKAVKSEISIWKREKAYSSFYPGEDKGFYQSFNVGLMYSGDFKHESKPDIKSGISGQYSLGYQFNKNILTGIGTGISYYRDTGIVDFFGQIRYSLLSRARYSPFIGLDVGYGFPFASSLLEVKGGYSFRPNIGLKIETRGDYNLLFDVGIQTQQLSYLEVYGSAFSTFKVVYLPLYFRIGYVFWKE